MLSKNSWEFCGHGLHACSLQSLSAPYPVCSSLRPTLFVPAQRYISRFFPSAIVVPLRAPSKYRGRTHISIPRSCTVSTRLRALVRKDCVNGGWGVRESGFKILHKLVVGPLFLRGVTPSLFKIPGSTHALQCHIHNVSAMIPMVEQLTAK